MSQLLNLDIINKITIDNLYTHPFPHIILDNFFPLQLVNDLHCMALDIPTQSMFRHSNHITDLKYETSDGLNRSKSFAQLRAFLDSPFFIEKVSSMLGISEPLLPDCDFFGSGIHCMPPGGFLEMHLDFRIHPKTKLNRRLNALLYLNKHYFPAYGGHLVIAHKSKPHVTAQIEPLFNRLVIFPTNDYTFHGVPNPIPLDAPSRYSIAYYYYSKDRPYSDIDKSRRYDSTVYISSSLKRTMLIKLLRLKQRILTRLKNEV